MNYSEKLQEFKHYHFGYVIIEKVQYGKSIPYYYLVEDTRLCYSTLCEAQEAVNEMVKDLANFPR